MKNTLLLLLTLVLLSSCHTRYAYRSKIRVKNPTAISQKEKQIADTTIEASTQDMVIIKPSPFHEAVTDSAEEIKLSLKDVNKQEEQIVDHVLDSASQKQIHILQRPDKNHKSSTSMFIIGSIVVLAAMISILLGATVEANVKQPEAGAPSYFFILAVLLLFLGALFFFLALICLIAESIK